MEASVSEAGSGEQKPVPVRVRRGRCFALARSLHRAVDFPLFCINSPLQSQLFMDRRRAIAMSASSRDRVRKKLLLIFPLILRFFLDIDDE